jgi:hypothetical protein
MPKLDENTFSKLIAMMEDGCSASSSARALGLKNGYVYFKMSPQQRQQFDYVQATNMHKYAAEVSHKPRVVRKMEQ